MMKDPLVAAVEVETLLFEVRADISYGAMR